MLKLKYSWFGDFSSGIGLVFAIFLKRLNYMVLYVAAIVLSNHFRFFSFHPGLFIKTRSFSIFDYWSFCIFSAGFKFNRFAIQNNTRQKKNSETFAQIHVQDNPGFEFNIDDLRIGLWISHHNKVFVDFYEEGPQHNNQGTSQTKADTMGIIETG